MSATVARVIEFIDGEVLGSVASREAAGDYPHDLAARMRELGLFGLPISREYGGSAAPIDECARVLEEVGRGWASLADLLSTHFTAARLIQEVGSEEQRRRYLPAMAAGDSIGGIALTERAVGSDLRAVELTARREGDGYVLEGEKFLITHVDHADPMVVFARVVGEDSRAEGYRFFLVAQEDEGVRTQGDLTKLGHKNVEFGGFALDAVRLGVDRALEGRDGDGFAHLLSVINFGRLWVASGSLGIARRALEVAVEQTASREAFGSPLAENPAVVDRLGEMSVRTESARALVERLGRALADPSLLPRRAVGSLAATAKIVASRAAVENGAKSLELHGGLGFTTER
ncbi:acyl-CoA dehydrogenase family protein, partial [Georgenia sp. 10Sc9-8]|nr:acyl-CoA dehydrogenase family protein [Georgenia halotolerans]